VSEHLSLLGLKYWVDRPVIFLTADVVIIQGETAIERRRVPWYLKG